MMMLGLSKVKHDQRNQLGKEDNPDGGGKIVEEVWVRKYISSHSSLAPTTLTSVPSLQKAFNTSQM